jgi:hypothetical protein
MQHINTITYLKLKQHDSFEDVDGKIAVLTMSTAPLAQDQ